MSLLSTSWCVGFTINFPSTLPTLTSAIGPSKGISEMVNAADAPIAPSTSASFSPSYESTNEIICVSFWNSFGNKGLIGLSISLAVSISFSVGLPSLLKNPPGIFPAADVLSRYSTCKGKNPLSSFASSAATAETNTIVSP